MKFTEKAIEAFKKEKKTENTMIRIAFEGFGWGGPKLRVVLEEQKNNDDIVIEVDNIHVVYEKALKPYIERIVVDYKNLLMIKGFYIKEGLSSC